MTDCPSAQPNTNNKGEPIQGPLHERGGQCRNGSGVLLGWRKFDWHGVHSKAQGASRRTCAQKGSGRLRSRWLDQPIPCAWVMTGLITVLRTCPVSFRRVCDTYPVYQVGLRRSSRRPRAPRLSSGASISPVNCSAIKNARRCSAEARHSSSGP